MTNGHPGSGVTRLTMRSLFSILEGFLVTAPHSTTHEKTRFYSFLDTCLKSTSKGALFLSNSISTTKPRTAGKDITGGWKVGEGYRGQISIIVKGEKQLRIRTT